MSEAAKTLSAGTGKGTEGAWENPMQTDGFEFVEFASPEPEPPGEIFRGGGKTPYVMIPGAGETDLSLLSGPGIAL